ncbi:hypothetical protein C8R45DRAFT_936529 [Mycena sanguinolenta]|nr:hypothetical protein C8R45DRAFT_936529 [Mycena sanguinolenta]
MGDFSRSLSNWCGLRKGSPLNSLSLLTIFGGEKTGNPTVIMNYKDYDKNIRGALGWQIFGWLTTSPFKAPSKMGTGGAGTIQTLWRRLHSGECGWEPVPEAIRAMLIAKYSETATDINTESTMAVKEKRKRVEADNIHDETNIGEGKAGKRKKRAQEAEVPSCRESKPRKSKRSNAGTISNPLLTYSRLVRREGGARRSGGSNGGGGSNGKTTHSSSSTKPVSIPPIRTMTEGSNSDLSDDSDE